MSTASPPRATARLQFHTGFTLDDAIPVLPYLARLGISHLYASPLTKARAGSTHGYDIVDHAQVNPELGGEEALRRLAAALKAEGMGLILDIVPNHMGVGGSDNAIWLDLLEWGQQSRYANFLDIDWDPPDPLLRGKLLAPFLGAPYGEVLASGDLKLQFDPLHGKLYAGYFDHRFPIAPRHYGHVLRASDDPKLEPLAQAFGRVGLSQRDRAVAHTTAEGAQRALAEIAATPEGAKSIATALAAFDASDPEGRERLHKLLERQHWRLAWWRAAADEINWRRFFDVNGLAGLRQEEPEVFDATHELPLRLYAEGVLDGLRIDHVDGIADPRGYCRKLRRRMEAVRPGFQGILWVEKILAPFESLRRDWLTDGTTGYDFMDEASGVLHDPQGEAALTALWAGLTGRPAEFETEAQEARRQILRHNLASELNAAAAALRRVAVRDLVTRDFSMTAIRRALTEVLVHFPVYRMYVGTVGRAEEDRRWLARAISGARGSLRATDRPLLDLLDAWLGGEPPRSLPPAQRRERLAAAVRVQQLSAPCQAKSVEDTAFYRYGRLLSRNEVGADPARFSITPAAFHVVAKQRQKHFPHALLATATHDHKRGEDSRARLAVLSEIPDEWEAALRRWTRLNASLRKEVEGGPAPDAADEVMLYQTLLGAWPLDLDPADEPGVAALIERVAAWQEKALREAKRQTDWAVPNAEYEAACRDFLHAALSTERTAPVRADIAGFAQRLAPPGAVNSLAQTLLRCTAPGLPDLYQGTEFWDLSLVDPDNRRPVDFAARAAALKAGAPPASLLPEWRDGRVKQAVIARALALRRAEPALFAEGDYIPLKAEGPAAEHVLAFVRRLGRSACVVAVTRLPAVLLGAEAALPLPPAAAWEGTSLPLPQALAGTALRDMLGDALPVAPLASGAAFPAATLFAGLPVALLATVAG
jgi:(1->4)-alpha-D-glucan 1-alpha-D-glucosylmutase